MKRGLRSARRAAYAATCISYCAVSGSSVAWLKFVYGGLRGGFRRRFWSRRRVAAFVTAVNEGLDPGDQILVTEVKVPGRMACRVMMPKSHRGKRDPS